MIIRRLLPSLAFAGTLAAQTLVQTLEFKQLQAKVFLF